MFVGNKPLFEPLMVIGIDHDSACAGVVGTAIQHSTRCDLRPRRPAQRVLCRIAVPTTTAQTV